MLKRVTALLVICAVVLMAMGTVPVTAEDNEVMKLSLEEAMELALKNNPDMALNQTGIEKAQVGLKEAKSASNKASDAIDAAGASLELLNGKYVAPRQAQMAVTLAEMGAEFSEKTLLMGVESAYYDVLKAEADVNNTKAAWERSKEQLRLAEASFKAGVVAKSDVMGAQVGVTSAEVELASAQNKLDIKMMSLAKTLGLDLKQRFELTDKFEYTQSEDYDLEVYLEELMKTDMDVISAQEALVIIELQLEQIAKIYTPNVYTYKKAAHDVEAAKLKLQKAKTELAFNVRQAYLNLKSAEKAYLLLEESAKYAEETARLAALRYEAGVATQLEMEQAYDKLNETEAQRLSMLYNYNLAKTQLDYGIFLGSGGSAAAGAESGMDA